MVPGSGRTLRLPISCPFGKQIWGEAVYVITIRNPLDVAISWQKFIMPSNLTVRVSFVAMNLLRWQHMVTLILRDTEDAPHRLFIQYEDIMRAPREQAERLSNYLNSKFENRGSRIQAMVDVVDSRLWRNHCGIPFDRASEATDHQKALYAFARQKIVDPFQPFDSARIPMPPRVS